LEEENGLKSIDFLNHVLEKAKSAIKYCNYALEYTAENEGKPWKYVLIPHDIVAKSSSFMGLLRGDVMG